MTKEPDVRHRLGAARAALLLAAVGGLVTLVGLAALVWQSTPTKMAPKADPDNARQVAVGREIYVRRCAGCHGKQLEGQADWRVRKADGRLPAPPHNETGHTWHHTDEQLFELTKQGGRPFGLLGNRSGMPAFGPILTDDEIWAVLAFIKSSWPKRLQERQPRIDEATRQ